MFTSYQLDEHGFPCECNVVTSDSGIIWWLLRKKISTIFLLW